MRVLTLAAALSLLAAAAAVAGPVGVSANGDAEGSLLAVSGTGEARGQPKCESLVVTIVCTAPVAVSASGDARGTVAVSGLGDAHTEFGVALSGAGDASGCTAFVACIPMSALGTCNGAACTHVDPTGPASAQRLAVSVLADASCQDADGCAAASASGDAAGASAVSVLGDAETKGGYCWPVLCTGGVIVSVAGNATGCRDIHCSLLAASVLSDAEGGKVAASGAGDARDAWIGIAGGSARESSIAVGIEDATSTGTCWLGATCLAGPAAGILGDAGSDCSNFSTGCEFGIAAAPQGDASCVNVRTCIAASGGAD